MLEYANGYDNATLIVTAPSEVQMSEIFCDEEFLDDLFVGF